jgi:CheY-like chemotaxis protein
MTSRKKILIVDDNPMNLKLVDELLRLAGFDTMKSMDAEEAQVIIREHHPDLILMDIALPGMDGLQLTRILKSDQSTRDIKVIAVTAFAMKSDLDRVDAAGCDGCITKPINTRTFIDEIAKFL